MIWTFYEPGVIPGVPGQFANCRVELGDDGQPIILPRVPAAQAEEAQSEQPQAQEPEQIEEA